MSSVTFLAIFSLLGLFYLVLGIAVSKKIKTVKDYFLAGRGLGLGALTFTLVATQIGGGMLLGSADAAYQDGYFGIFYSLGMSVGFLILGFGLAGKLRQFNVVTTAELFETKYQSVFLRKTAGLISALSMIGIFAAQVVASRALFNVLGVGSEGVLLMFWVFVIVYTMVGGLKAVVITDVFQVLFLICIITGIFLYSISNGTGIAIDLNIFGTTQAHFTGLWPAIFKQLPIFLTAAIYPLFGQDLTQRFFAAKDKKVAIFSALLAGAIIVGFAFVPVYFGIQAKLMGLIIPAKTSVFYSVIGVLTNDFVLALVGCALIAAITSTADSLLCAISSNITQDFKYVFSSEKKKLVVSQGITCLAGIAGILIAYVSQNILGVIAQSYGLLISCLFVPVLFCFVTDRLSKLAAIGAVAGGAISFFALKFCMWQGCYVPSELMQLCIPVAISFVGYVVTPTFRSTN